MKRLLFIIVAWLWMVAPASAAIATCATGSTGADNGGSTSSVSWSFNAQGSCGASNYALLVVIEGDTAVDDVTGCTYNAVAMTKLGASTFQGTTGRYGQTYGLLSPASGSNTVQCTASTTHYLFGTSISYSGVSGFGATATSSCTGVAQCTSGSLTTTQANSWIYTHATTSNGTTWTGVTNATFRSEYAPFNSPAQFDNGTAVAVGSYTTTVDGGANGDMGVLVVELKAAGGGGGGTVKGLMTTGVGDTR